MTEPTVAAAPTATDWHPERLLTPDEFCDWAGVSKRTFRQWCVDGTAPRRIRIGRHTRVLVRDALAWAEAKYVH